MLLPASAGLQILRGGFFSAREITTFFFQKAVNLSRKIIFFEPNGQQRKIPSSVLLLSIANPAGRWEISFRKL
jgi:hypothetical protein